MPRITAGSTAYDSDASLLLGHGGTGLTIGTLVLDEFRIPGTIHSTFEAELHGRLRMWQQPSLSRDHQLYIDNDGVVHLEEKWSKSTPRARLNRPCRTLTRTVLNYDRQ